MTAQALIRAPARLEIFGNRLSAVPDDAMPWPYGLTIDRWMRISVRTYEPIEMLRARGLEAPCSIEIDGQLIPPERWAEVVPPLGSLVRCWVEPDGGAFRGIGKLFSGLLNMITRLFVSKPKTASVNNTPQGEELQGASLKTNAAKLGSVIPQLAGWYESAPDYLLPPYRWFEDDDQFLQVLFCIGWGRYQVLAENVKIAGTPISSLGSGADYRVYEPGADLSGDARRIHWHECVAVGSTSTGSFGLELRSTYDLQRVPDAQLYRFEGRSVVIPEGAGSFPDGWAGGLTLRIEAPQSITFVDGGQDAQGNQLRTVLEGDFSSLLPEVGMRIELALFNAGTYSIASYTAGQEGTPAIPPDPDDPDDNGTPAVPATRDRITLDNDDGTPALWLTTGEFQAAIGPAGLRYTTDSASSQVLTVSRLTSAGATDTDWPGFVAAESRDARLELDGSTFEGNWQGGFTGTPAGAKTRRIQVSWMLSEGLAHIDDKGRVKSRSVTVEAQYRDADLHGDWSSVRYTYSASTLDQFGRTETIELPYEMAVEVRARRIGATSTDTQNRDKILWYSLYAELPSLTSYEGMTVMALTIRGGENLSQQSENQITVAPTRILPVRRNGQWQSEQPTRDVMPFVYNVLRDVGGLDQINLAEADRIDEILRARGDTFDGKFDSDTTVKQALKDLLAVGFCDYTLYRNQIRVVRNGPRTAWGYLYTPRRQTKRLVTNWTNRRRDDHDAVEVTYRSSQTWQNETVLCYLPGSPRLRVKKVTIPGVTDRARAWRLGMREIRSMLYQNKSYAFSTELDLLNSYYWSHDAVTDDVQGVSQNVLLRDHRDLGDGTALITVNEPIRWIEGEINGVTLSKPNGRMSGPWEARRIDGNPYQLIIDMPDFVPDVSGRMDSAQVVFGPISRSVIPILMTRLSPGSNNQVSAEALNYDSRVFLDDDNSPPDD